MNRLCKKVRTSITKLWLWVASSWESSSSTVSFVPSSPNGAAYPGPPPVTNTFTFNP